MSRNLKWSLRFATCRLPLDLLAMVLAVAVTSASPRVACALPASFFLL